MVYTGIGSRDCPKWVENLIIKTGTWLAKKGYILRSGGADGCDTAFEKGCDIANGKKEIYIPWKGFNNSKSSYYLPYDLNSVPIIVNIARHYHPKYESLSVGAKKLHARNCNQVLGKDLNSPTDFVLCYTKNGSGTGGTGQALRIAKGYGIPIFDFGKYKDIESCRKGFLEFMENINLNKNEDKMINIEKSLRNRGLEGDKLLDSLDIASDIIRVNGKISDKGIATLYHRTDKVSADKIYKEQSMITKEDCVFMSTHSNKQIVGYGDTVVIIEVPIEKLVLDDEFKDELHYKVMTKFKGKIPMQIKLA